MGKNGWRERIERAKTLAEQYTFAEEVLRFYIRVAEFQADLYLRMEKSAQEPCGRCERIEGGVQRTSSGVSERLLEHQHSGRRDSQPEFSCPRFPATLRRIYPEPLGGPVGRLY